MRMFAVGLKRSVEPKFLTLGGFNSYVNKFDYLTTTHPRLFHTVEEARIAMRIFKVPFRNFEIVPMDVTATKAGDRAVFGG